MKGSKKKNPHKTPPNVLFNGAVMENLGLEKCTACGLVRHGGACLLKPACACMIVMQLCVTLA